MQPLQPTRPCLMYSRASSGCSFDSSTRSWLFGQDLAVASSSLSQHSSFVTAYPSRLRNSIIRRLTLCSWPSTSRSMS